MNSRIILPLALLVLVGPASHIRGALAQDAPAANDAQDRLKGALELPAVKAALAHIDGATDRTARFLGEIGAIISPSGQEADRAARVAERMREIGLSRVHVDESPNAIGVIPGRSGRALVFVSTLDDLATVAEHQKAADGPPQVEGDRVVGPGTNTSSTTASILAAAEALVESGLSPEHDLVFAAVAQEETGLKGMKYLCESLGERALAYVDVLGDGLHHGLARF